MRKAKIVATLGPSSDTKEKIRELIQAGLNVARINMSHGDHNGHAKVIKTIRQVAKECGKSIGILLDLQGPKIRVDKLPKPFELNDGEKWTMGTSDVVPEEKWESEKFIPSIYKNLVADCEEGCRILFDDGLLEAKVVKKLKDRVEIEVITGGTLKSNKGINLPDIKVSAPSLTEKDEKDLMFGLEQGIDFIALSFVRTAQDVLDLKYRLHKLKLEIPVVAKIEKPEAVDAIEEIIRVTDIIMIARGDMGVELGNHLVPAVQKTITRICNETGTPVITATQMLESMIDNPRPTRAEASDVANAIWDGTDAVMLSGETAAGKYPIQAVKTMAQIIEEAERSPKERPLLRNMDLSGPSAALQVSASLISEKVYAKWIVVFTQTGRSCRQMAMFRPTKPVLGVTNSIEVSQRMSLYWGITPHLYDDDMNDLEKVESTIISYIRSIETIVNGDKIVISRGDGNIFQQGQSNLVRIEIIKDAPKVLGGEDSTQEAEVEGKGRIMLDTSVCASCHQCVQVCPHDIWAITDDDNKDTYINKIKVNSCEMDMQCVEVCPSGAIEIIPFYS